MFMLGAEDDTLSEFAEDSKAGRADKTLVKEGSLRITLVAFEEGNHPAISSSGGSRQYPDHPWMSETHHRQE
jgi:hypothetical protein